MQFRFLKAISLATFPYHRFISPLLLLCMVLPGRLFAAAPAIDFSKAIIINASDKSETETAAIQMFIEEVMARSIVRLREQAPANVPQIVVGTRSSIMKQQPYAKWVTAQADSRPDGFTISLVDGNSTAPKLLVLGNDSRGLLFGIGYVLRKSSFAKGKISIPLSIPVTTAPAVPIRGHQLGYRPKVNSYDGFTVQMWEQYIRDLAVFGTNAIELMAPFTDDDSDSPMFPLPQKEMLVEMSGLLKKYGLDAWIWYPLMHGDYSKKEVIERSLQENDSIFRSMPKLDAVFVPGGDPGKQDPEVLFKHLERQLKLLHKYHPKAQIWMSPQGYNAEWMDKFIRIMKGKPKALTGIVHGPWTRMDADSLRKIIPAEYPIRRYPDITHNIDAQYYVPDWDFAYTVTENRESINPRPLDQQTIYKAVDPASFEGFISYSEGVNDDVNKIIWSGLGWNRDTPVIDILRDYSRYFIGSQYADDFAQGLLSLEQNWRKALLTNQGVYSHHAIFQALEKNASPAVRLNWRFQMALYRSYYDAYTRSRLAYENHLEDAALSALRGASQTGSLQAMQKARNLLARATEERISPDWRQRVFELAEALFQSIRMQLSVPKYHAIATIRGANLDLVDSPLNNRFWLEKQFDRIAEMKDEAKRIQEIQQLLDWENPGPGGFYDDLGNPDHQPHLVLHDNYAKDPNSFHSVFAGLPGGYSLEMDRIRQWRVSWKTYMQTIYGLPLQLRYENLDPEAEYQVKVTYIEDIPLKLTANNGIVVHDFVMPEFDPRPLVFDVPARATQNGILTLSWQIDPNGDGPGRGCSVAEVWLMKKKR